MKILITGGFGFIGSHLSESLVKNHQIILLSRSKRKWKNIEKIEDAKETFNQKKFLETILGLSISDFLIMNNWLNYSLLKNLK